MSAWTPTPFTCTSEPDGTGWRAVLSYLPAVTKYNAPYFATRGAAGYVVADLATGALHQVEPCNTGRLWLVPNARRRLKRALAHPPGVED